MKLSISALLAPLLLFIPISLFLAINVSHSNVLYQATSLLLLLFIPGFIATFALKFRTTNIWNYVFHSFGISIGLIYVEGLLASYLLPQMGFSRPLEMYPFIYIHEALIFVLWIVALFRNRYSIIFANEFVSRMMKFTGYLVAVFLSLTSVIGAFYLNNGGSNTLALAWLFTLVVLLFILSLFQNQTAKKLRPYFILTLSLSVLWMLSARSWNLVGWDIVEESVVAKTTLAAGKWSVNDIRDAYNACLSITILPTIVSNVTSLSVEFLYKFIYPFLFAQFPLLIYFWAKRIANKDLTFFAVIYIISQPFFNQSMVGLARQEVAFYFFPLLLMAIFSNIVRHKTKIFLVLFYTFALVTSHYSTSYVSIILFTLAYAVIFTLLVLKMVPMPSFITKLTFYKNWVPSYKSAIKWWMVGALVGFTYCWYFLFTNSAGNVQALIVHSLSGMSNLFKNEQKSQEVRSALPGVSNAATTSQSDLEFYQHSFDRQLDNLKPDRINEIISKYPLNPFYETLIPTAIANGNLANVFLNRLKDALKLILIGGALVQFLKTFRKSKQNIDLVIFSCVSAVFLMVMLFHPTLGLQYNIARIYLQLMVFLAVSLLVGLDTLLWLIPPKARNVLISFTLLVTLLYLQGALVPFIGGTPALQFYQKGNDYDKNYVFQGELVAAKWLQENRQYKNAVYGDDFSGLRIRKVAFFFPRTIIVPVVLDNDASGYVYLSNTNKNSHRAFVNFGNKLLTYEYPNEYLDESRNLIYSNKNSAIYR